ncbi:unnamed protein product [Tilletia controversa]|nr:unnamed protein product [Tilletia controversa]
MLPSPSSSRSSASLPLSSNRSLSTSAVRSTATSGTVRSPLSDLPRLPSISQWFPSASNQIFSSSQLSTPLNKLKIAQPILPSSPQLKPSGSATGRPVFLGLERAFPPASPLVPPSPTLLPVAIQVPSQARPGARRESATSITDFESIAGPSLASTRLYENEACRDKDSVRASSVASSTPMQAQSHIGRRVRSANNVGQRDLALRNTTPLSSTSTLSSLTAASATQGSANNIFAASQTQQHAEYVLENQSVNFDIDATSRDCFSKIAGKWTCYRRNYLKVDALVHAHLSSRDNSHGLENAPSSPSTARKRSSLEVSSTRTLPVFVTLTVHVAGPPSTNADVPRNRANARRAKDKGDQVSLVQFGPERERGERLSVQPQALLVNVSGPSSFRHRLDQDCGAAMGHRGRRWSQQQHSLGIDDGEKAVEDQLASFRRIQIRRATTNNGRLGDDDRSEQQYFFLRISIRAASEQDEGFFDGKGDTPPPPLKKRRRSSASSLSLSSYSGSSSFGSSAHNSSAPVCNSKTSDQPTAAAGLGTLLATLDSAPVTIRGRSRKHFAGAAASSC